MTKSEVIRPETPKCIYCGGKIQKMISGDHLIPSTSHKYKLKQMGYCVKCLHGYEWIEHYEYKGFSNLREQK
jgi:uncharacterized protein with PIN domain